MPLYQHCKMHLAQCAELCLAFRLFRVTKYFFKKKECSRSLLIIRTKVDQSRISFWCQSEIFQIAIVCHLKVRKQCSQIPTFKCDFHFTNIAYCVICCKQSAPLKAQNFQREEPHIWLYKSALFRMKFKFFVKLTQCLKWCRFYNRFFTGNIVFLLSIFL